jgi:hypothetical protein
MRNFRREGLLNKEPGIKEKLIVACFLKAEL